MLRHMASGYKCKISIYFRLLSFLSLFLCEKFAFSGKLRTFVSEI